jgi:outer membrane autotransporter protein
LPGGVFSVQTTGGDSDNALLGAGVNAELNQNVTLFIDYQAEAGGSSFFGQSASAGVKVCF